MMMPKMMHLMALIAMFLGIALAAEPEAGATSRAGAEKAAPTPGQAEAEPGSTGSSRAGSPATSRAGSPATSGAGSPGATPPAGSPARSSGGPGASAPGGGSSLSSLPPSRTSMPGGNRGSMSRTGGGPVMTSPLRSGAGSNKGDMTLISVSLAAGVVTTFGIIFS